MDADRGSAVQQAVQLIIVGGKGGAAAPGASRIQPLDFETEAAELAEVTAVHKYRQLADGGGAASAAEAPQQQQQQQQPPPPPLDQLQRAPEQPLLLPAQAAVQQPQQGPPGLGSAARAEPVVDPEVQVLRQRTWAADYVIGLDGRPQLATWPKVSTVQQSCSGGARTLLSSSSTS